MHALIWNCPWAGQGDLFFFEGCFERHLLLQANTLAEAGWSVSVAYPRHLQHAAQALSSRAKAIILPDAIVQMLSGRDALSALYEDQRGEVSRAVADALRPWLPSTVDAVLSWENPTSYLRDIYPDALIVNQMPGAFCRPPFPNTVTFDTEGLYRSSVLAKWGREIVVGSLSSNEMMAGHDFREAVIDALNQVSPFSADDLGRRDATNVLLPLQVSNHYAFKADTGFSSQLELLAAASAMAGPDRDLVVTQYRSKFANDITLDESNFCKYRSMYGNIVWDNKIDRLSSPSQLLIPSVSDVITSSSSIGLQAAVVGLPVHVIGDTHVSPFSSLNLKKEGVLPDLAGQKLAAFLVNRYQPLYTAVTSDGKFLTSLLEELIFLKRSALSGFHATVNFSSIDPIYYERVRREFTTDSVILSISKTYPVIANRSKEIRNFADAVKKTSVSVISFDLFDTLIFRPTENPSDVYRFLQLALDERFGLRFPEFARVRMDAENEARVRCPDPEISLDLIYDIVAERFALDNQTRDLLKQIEVEVETRFISARPRGRAMWDVAVASGKDVIIVSDMYLPHSVIEAMVSKAGYSGYRRLFVSSSHGARKKDGGLFDIVLSELGVSASAVVHVGDHIESDIRNAEARGIKAVRTPRAIDILRKHSDFRLAYKNTSGTGDVSRSAVVGLTAAKLFDREPTRENAGSLFQGSSFNLGYAGLGPLYTGFALWILDQARSDGITDLYFLSREGHLIKEIYDIVAAEFQDSPESHYLYASRRATRVASIQSEADVREVASQPYTAGIKLSELLTQRFGLSAALISQRLVACSIPSQTVLDKDQKSRSFLFAAIDALMPEILEHSAEEHRNYVAYLSQMGMADGRRLAVVDIGWKGNMQGGLGRLLNRGLTGYYFATLAGAERWRLEGHIMRAYSGTGIGPWSNNVIGQHRHLMEAMACNTDQSIITVRKSGAGFQPVFRSDPVVHRHNQFIKQAHRGAADFARRFTASFAPFLSGLRIEPELATLTLCRLISNPTEADARLVADLMFEDGFGGVMPKSVLHAGSSVWPEGSAALAAPLKAEKSEDPKAKELPVDSTIMCSPGKATNESSRPIEKVLVWMISGIRGRKKYIKNPDRFFAESKSPIIRAWGNLR